MLSSQQIPIGLLPESAFPETWRVMREGVAAGVAPGVVLGVWRASDPDRFLGAAHGQRRLIPSPQPVSIDTVYDLASVSKVIGAATLAGLLVDRGWLSYETPLRAIFPDYPFPEILISHLLSHTAGYAAWQPFWEKLRERFVPRFVHEVAIEERQRVMRELIFAVKPEAKPGEKAVYSDISFLLLGFALEEITKLPLDHAVTEMVLKPMGLATAYYRRVNQSATSGVDERVAATEQCPWRGAVIQGQVHDDNCWAMGGYAGHAGVFGAAADVLTFARRLYGGFLTRETLARCWTRVDRPPGCERTLGWDTPSPQGSMVGPDFSPNSVGHWGFAGTSLWIDRDAELAVTILTNRVHPSRENNLIRGFRPTLHSALRRELAAFSRKV